uniref:Uncharacterized protein n=1 Tax=Cebus imitator TaxID=2715852 RepID=A0A2K5PW96_CEBIM
MIRIVSVVARKAILFINLGEKGHISPQSRCVLAVIDWLQLLTLGLGGLRRGNSPSSSSDMYSGGGGWGWMSLGRDLGLSLITHKNATLAESRPVSLAGSTTKKMLFPCTVI